MLRKYAPGLWEKRTEVGIDLYRRASPAIITAHKCPRRKWVAACFNDSSSTVMNKTEKWQRLDASRSAVITTGEQCTQCYELFCPHCRFGCKKKNHWYVWHQPCTLVTLFLSEGLFFFFFNLNAPKCHRVCKSGLDLGQTERRKLKKEDWKRWNKWINNPLRYFIKKTKTTTAKQILMFATRLQPCMLFLPWCNLWINVLTQLCSSCNYDRCPSLSAATESNVNEVWLLFYIIIINYIISASAAGWPTNFCL